MVTQAERSDRQEAQQVLQILQAERKPSEAKNAATELEGTILSRQD